MDNEQLRHELDDYNEEMIDLGVLDAPVLIPDFILDRCNNLEDVLALHIRFLSRIQ